MTSDKKSVALLAEIFAKKGWAWHNKPKKRLP
jgi:hypothetical protein